MKKFELNSQGIGSAKRSIGENKSKMTDQEKMDMVRRQRVEQYLKYLQEGKMSPEKAAQ